MLFHGKLRNQVVVSFFITLQSNIQLIPSFEHVRIIAQGRSRENKGENTEERKNGCGRNMKEEDVKSTSASKRISRFVFPSIPSYKLELVESTPIVSRKLSLGVR
jgi:hypothetical protein